jgi:hypothetical protein
MTRFAVLGIVLASALLVGCSMMRPPALEQEYEATPIEEAAAQAPANATYTHQQVIDAITATLRQFKFTLKRTDVQKGEVETEWRREESFEGGGPGAGYGSEDIYRSFVVVSYDFAKNRVNIKRQAQFLDFYINDWRDVAPRRYHREEDMEMQKVIMQQLARETEPAEQKSPEP